MLEIWRSAQALEQYLRRQGFHFCFIGGIALQRWGEPRMTRDLDLTLLTGFGNESPYIEALIEQYTPRLDDAAEFAKLNRILLLG